METSCESRIPELRSRRIGGKIAAPPLNYSGSIRPEFWGLNARNVPSFFPSVLRPPKGAGGSAATANIVADIRRSDRKAGLSSKE